MAKYVIEESTLTGIADAIREKEGSSAVVPVLDMRQRILDIETGTDTSAATAEDNDVAEGETYFGADGELHTGNLARIVAEEVELLAGESHTIQNGIHDGTGKVTAKDLASQTKGDATAADMLSGKKAWVNGVEVTGGIACYDLENNDVVWTLTDVPLTSGNATMVVDLQEGHYAEGRYNVGTLAMYKPSDVTPGTEDIEVPGGAWFMNGFTIVGDENLIESNIRSGTSIFGVTGTLVEQEDLSSEISTQQSLISQIETALATKAAAS